MSTETTTESFRSGMCIYTSRAVDLFKSGKPGDSYAREDLAIKIGRPVDLGTLGYGNLMSAIRHVERLFGIVWRWNSDGKRYLCLNSSQAAADAKQSLKRSGNFAKRALQTARTVKPEELTDDERRLYNATCIQAELIRISSNGSTTKTLCGAKETKPIDATKLLAMLT